MKTSLATYKLFLLVLAVGFTACSSGNQENTDSSTANTGESSDQSVEPEKIFENDYARVFRVQLEPGESLSPHEGGPRLIYSLSDYSIDWVENGEQEGTKNWKQGDVHAHGEGMHAATNNGQTTAEWIAFVRKSDQLPACEMQSQEEAMREVSGEQAKVLYEDDMFKIAEVQLAAGEEIPMHEGMNRLIYSMSDYTMAYLEEGEGATQTTYKAGDVHWHDACNHSVSNPGDNNARFLVVGYKE